MTTTELKMSNEYPRTAFLAWVKENFDPSPPPRAVLTSPPKAPRIVNAERGVYHATEICSVFLRGIKLPDASEHRVRKALEETSSWWRPQRRSGPPAQPQGWGEAKWGEARWDEEPRPQQKQNHADARRLFQQVAKDATAALKLLDALSGVYGSTDGSPLFGHNAIAEGPITREEFDDLRSELHALKRGELKNEKNPSQRLRSAASTVGSVASKVAKWLGEKVNRAADKAADTAGTELGKLLVEHLPAISVGLAVLMKTIYSTLSSPFL
ncbi:hypothetical protein [Plastoroseomonas hellenica]|uniref:hypothetical protein n=1 Tax=Plastoroseomonas hellenica TaxID=2687306 RepID=UPI001BAAB6B8|nr:hypothetical protein [Plastoroseomonas hellenica]MBR0643981.1 hypothetical protein [Plastoroseomonas hellenica]